MLHQLNNCLCCGSDELKLVLNLGLQPLANNYVTSPQSQELFPLALNHCQKCTHLQLTHSVDRSAIFTDYPYVSGTTQTLRDDFADFAQRATDKYGVGTVLDIACNDGSQLDAFKNLGWTTIGIDPAANLHPTSSAKHTVYCDFLNDSHRSLKADLIVAQNVVAHTDNPQAFLSICADIAPIVLVQTSQAHMVQNGEFDTIYHEHISFFSERSMLELARHSGLVLTNIMKRPVHGISFLFELRRSGQEMTNLVDIASAENVQTFTNKAIEMISDLRRMIDLERDNGQVLIGYGAAAKGMTVLNAANRALDYIVDDNPLKHNLFTPGLNIPIYSPDRLNEETKPSTVIPLAWNFYPEIKAKVQSRLKAPTTFIRYFPHMVVE